MLGDVDVNTENNESTEPTCFYSIEEIKKRYADFLELTDEPEPGDLEEAVNSSEERPPRSSDDNRSNDHSAIKKQLSSEILDKGPAIGQYSHVSKSLQLTLLRQVASDN